VLVRFVSTPPHVYLSFFLPSLHRPVFITLLCFLTTHLFWLSLSLSLVSLFVKCFACEERLFFWSVYLPAIVSRYRVCSVSSSASWPAFDSVRNLTLCFFLQVQSSFFCFLVAFLSMLYRSLLSV
jgi:hypothetical protein